MCNVHPTRTRRFVGGGGTLSSVSTPQPDEGGRFTWVVTWGRPGRRDWKIVHVKAHDADEALQIARDEHPELLPPTAAILGQA